VIINENTSFLFLFFIFKFLSLAFNRFNFKDNAQN